MANMNFGVNILPKANNTYSLGNSDYKWNIYANSINGTGVSNLFLPTVSSPDNGKVLGVSSGAWTVVDAPSGLPSISSADNGKILQVSSGAWTVSTLTIPTKVSDLQNDSGFVTTDTTYSTFIQSGSSAAGGLVPAPSSTAGTTAFLCEDGTWKIPTDTTYSTFVGSGSSAAAGLVPAPSSTEGTSKFLCEDGTWAVPPDTTYSVMTGATASVAGSAGLVPAPATTDVDKFLAGDGTYKSGGLPMVILSYGNSTWNDFLAAYNNNVIVYCRASSNSNPKTGTQGRMAFMAYIGFDNSGNPKDVEFQYYRSVSSHSATQMGDQVFIYKLTNANAWSVTTREASPKEIKAGTNQKIGVSWSSNVVTLSNTMTANDMPMSSTDATTTKATIDALNTKIAPLTEGEKWADFVSVSTLTNGENYGSGCKYRRIGCFVHILIGVQFSAAPTNMEIFTLPVGYRPVTTTTILIDGGATYNAKAQCTISDAGVVRVTSVDKWAIGGGLFVAVGNL